MEIKNTGSKKKHPFSYPTMKKMFCSHCLAFLDCNLVNCACETAYDDLEEENIDENDELTGEIIRSIERRKMEDPDIKEIADEIPTPNGLPEAPVSITSGVTTRASAS